VKPANALRLYTVRLRARFWQECFALVGIAAGVALLLASQIASSSLQSSVSQLSHGIVGNATLQLLARSPEGFPESTLAQVRRIPGVRLAAPLLETEADAIGPRGRESVELIGADKQLSKLGGTLVRDTSLAPFGGIGALVLPAPLAKTIGVSHFGQEIHLQLAGHSTELPLYAQLTQRQIGPLITSPVALAPLSSLQEISGRPGRLSRILIQPAPGAEARVRASLLALARGRLNVESTGYDERLFSTAAAANNHATELFAAVSALVGFLFAFNAMLLSVPQRRRLVADLRRIGYTPSTVIALLALDALVLGALACALGLALGDQLSIHLFHSNPAFLSLAFALGSQRVVSLQSVAIAGGAGMVATVVAMFTPLRDILSRDPLAAIRTRDTPTTAPAAGRLALAGIGCVILATAILLAAPWAAIAAMVLLVGALLLELPIALAAALALVKRLASRIVSPIPHVAAMELGSISGRAVAIAGTGAIAVFGAVTLQGAHANLLSGLEGAARETNASAQLWVSPAGAYNTLNTASFAPDRQGMLERLPGVRAVRVYRGGLLDYGSRRVLVSAPARQAKPLLPAGQLLQGDAERIEAHVRAGGWLVLSQVLADEHHLHVGQLLTLPSASPIRFRLAGISTNLGWAPGAIVMNATDYARAWGSADASAYGILLDAGVSPARGAAEIGRALGPASGLAVHTSEQHAEQQNSLSRTALARLSEIATLILIVAVLAMATATGAMVWQRRPRLAKLRLEGLSRDELWRTMLLESFVLLGVGCLTGALFGLYGQQLADHALVGAVNFPVVYSVTLLRPLISLSLLAAAALVILAIPGYLAASVPASLALQD
jgi:putative ABC transport system permease protein